MILEELYRTAKINSKACLWYHQTDRGIPAIPFQRPPENGVMCQQSKANTRFGVRSNTDKSISMMEIKNGTHK